MTDLPEVAALTELQARFVDALISGKSPDEAKLAAGYCDTTPTISILRSKLVENAMSAICTARLHGPMRLKALSALDQLLSDTIPAATRLNAVKVVLDQTASGDQHGDAKPLSELGIEELERQVAALEAEREARMKDVTPKIGA